jgi:hypothetical protein
MRRTYTHNICILNKGRVERRVRLVISRADSLANPAFFHTLTAVTGTRFFSSRHKKKQKQKRKNPIKYYNIFLTNKYIFYYLFCFLVMILFPFSFPVITAASPLPPAPPARSRSSMARDARSSASSSSECFAAAA